MLRKLPAILITLLALTALLVGCGEKGKTQENSADPRKAFAGTTLKVLLKTGYEAEAIKQFVGDFEQATGIKVEYEIYDEPTMRNKFILDSTSQTGAYDVVATQFWYMPEYLRAGWLEPLDSYIAEKSDAAWSSVRHIPQGLLAPYKGSDGKLYALPVSASGGVLIYRKDIFEQYKIPVPQTTEDVLAAAKSLKAAGVNVYPFVGRGDPSSASFGTSAGWAWAYGAKVLDGERVTINTPEMKHAMGDFVQLLRQYGPPNQAVIGWDVMSELFRQGKAAMNFDMSGFPSVYANKEVSSVADKIGVTLLKGPGGKYAQWMYSEGLGISRYSKNKEAAWLFIQWRTSLDVAKKEFEAGVRYDFVDPRVYEVPEYKEKTKSIEFFTSQLPEILASVDATYWPAIPEFEQVAQAFQKEISAAIAGSKTVDQALAIAQNEVEKIITKK